MLKRFTAAVTASLVLLVGLTGANTASAVGTNTTNDPNRATDLILCGLWGGANFDVNISRNCLKHRGVTTTTPKTSITSPSTTQTPVPTPTTPRPATTTQQPVPPSANGGTYAALGDSVAAGLGLSGTNNTTSRNTQCGRSTGAYPYLVASSHNLSLNHVACSGATAGDLFTSQGVSGPNIPPQLDAAFVSGTPALITITAGANDAHWDDFLRACYAFDCATATNTTLADAYLVSLQLKLHYLFNDINRRSNGSPPQVVITGYYNPISGNCANLQQNVTAEEITWLTAETNALNQTIRQVSQSYSFVTFAPVSFAGHDICSSDPWVQGLGDSAPFHPTAQGQQMIAGAINRSIGP